MEKSWWWKAVLYGIVTIVACLYLVPTVVPLEKQPAIVQKLFTKKIQKGLDLAGGLRLVYSVNIDKAVAGKVDQMANSIEDNLRKKTQDFTIAREGRDDIVFTFKNPADVGKLDKDVLADHRGELDVDKDQSKGVALLHLDPDQVAEIQDLSLRQGIETLRGRVDQ